LPEHKSRADFQNIAKFSKNLNAGQSGGGGGERKFLGKKESGWTQGRVVFPQQGGF